ASAAASMLAPFTPPAPTASPAGVAAQAAAVAAATATSVATNTQGLLSQLTEMLPATLAGLAMPASPALDQAAGLIGASWHGTRPALTVTGPLGDVVGGITGSSTLSAATAGNAFVRLSQPIQNAVNTGNIVYGLGNALKPASSAAASAAQQAANAAN